MRHTVDASSCYYTVLYIGEYERYELWNRGNCDLEVRLTCKRGGRIIITAHVGEERLLILVHVDVSDGAHLLRVFSLHKSTAHVTRGYSTQVKLRIIQSTRRKERREFVRRTGFILSLTYGTSWCDH